MWCSVWWAARPREEPETRGRPYWVGTCPDGTRVHTWAWSILVLTVYLRSLFVRYGLQMFSEFRIFILLVSCIFLFVRSGFTVLRRMHHIRRLDLALVLYTVLISFTPVTYGRTSPSTHREHKAPVSYNPGSTNKPRKDISTNILTTDNLYIQPHLVAVHTRLRSAVSVQPFNALNAHT